MRFAAALFLACLGMGTATAASLLETEDCDFGETYAFNRAECEFTFINSGDTPIRVSAFQATRPDDLIEPTSAVISPHAKTYLKALVNTGNDSGTSRHIFHFHSDETGHEARTVVARGFAVSVLDQGRPIADFGVVNLGAELKTRKVDLTSHDVAGFRIEKIESKPAYVDAQISADGRSIGLKIRADAPWGYQGDYVKLTTTAAVQKEVWVGVQADIHGEVVPANNPFDLGVMRVGSRNEQLIRLTSKSGKDFAIGHIELENLRGSTSIEPCVPVATGCRMLRLRVSDDQTVGSVVGKVWLSLPEYSQRMLIAVHGLFLAKDTHIEKLDAAELMQGNSKDKAQSSAPAAATDIGKAIKSAVQTVDDSPPAGDGPLLKWSVMNEAALHGYQIFRAPDADGPFVLLNRQSVTVKKHDNTGSTYQWRDNTAASGKTYWYYIGLIYNDGHKQQLTGPQKVMAK